MNRHESRESHKGGDSPPIVCTDRIFRRQPDFFRRPRRLLPCFIPAFVSLTAPDSVTRAQSAIEAAAESSEAIAARIARAETGMEGDHMTGNWGGARDWLVDHGIHFSAGYSAEVFGNVSGGLKRGAVYEGLAELSLDIDPGKFSDWKGASFHVSSLYPHGNSPSGELTGDLSTVSNIDAYDSWVLFELWLDQSFLRDTMSVRFGQLAADEEFAATEYGGLFLNATFGWPSFISLNTPAPAFPLAAPGARLKFSPADSLYVQAAVYDGDPDPGDSRGRPVNLHGTRVNVNGDEGALILAEAGWSHQWAPWKERPLSGTLKLGGWYHTGDFEHLRLDNSGRSLADPLSTGVPRSLGDNWGVYGVVDQQLWLEPSEDEESVQGLAAFLRIAGSPDDRSLNSFYVDGGLNYQGLIPGRDADQAGLAVGWIRMSDELRRLARDAGETRPDAEVTIELTYQWTVNSWWTLQPDLQYIVHAGGSRAVNDALAIGLRSSFVF